jgi:hypothetical protein
MSMYEGITFEGLRLLAIARHGTGISVSLYQSGAGYTTVEVHFHGEGADVSTVSVKEHSTSGLPEVGRVERVLRRATELVANGATDANEYIDAPAPTAPVKEPADATR